MASVSLPNLEHSGGQQDLNVSRMSAGFADVSQLADEEKEKLDQLIGRLEEERRRMVATTQLLSSAQVNQAIEASPEKHVQSPREKERERLQSELKNIRHYNSQLEQELDQLRTSLHPGVPARSSTPRTHPVNLTHPAHTLSITHPSHAHDLTQSYYTPDNTMPKELYGAHFDPTPAQNMYHTPSSRQYHPDEGSQISPGHFEGVSGPHFEKLKGGESPIYRSPSMHSKKSQGYSPSSSRKPMKAAHHRSLGNSPIPPERESPIDFSKRSYRSLGNSPRDPDFGDTSKVGLWGSKKVLPNFPVMKPSAGPPRNHDREPFDGASPQLMYKSLQNERKSPRSSYSDTSHTSSRRAPSKHENRRSSREQTPESQRRISPSIQQMYQRHLEAEKSDHSFLTESQTSSTTGVNQAKPTPTKRRQKRSSTPQRIHDSLDQSRTTIDSKSYESDSLSDVSSKKRSTKSSMHSGKGSRRSSKEHKPTPRKHDYSSASHNQSGESFSGRSGRSDSKTRTNVLDSPNLSESSGNRRTKSRSGTKTVEPERKIKSRRPKSNRSATSSQHSHSDTDNSLVPPRKVSSHVNLNHGSMDSLDSLHGGVSNPSLGVYGTSKSGASTPQGTSGHDLTPRNPNYPTEFDPYSKIHSGDPNDLEKSTHTPQSSLHKISSLSPSNLLQFDPLDGDHESDVEPQKLHTDYKHRGKDGKGKRQRQTSSSTSSVDSRTMPEGDLEPKSENSSVRNFETPEEEMKFLVKKLQGMMPSVLEQDPVTSDSIDLKTVKPMSEVLVAAEQTRQAIKLFAEYAIAVAAGEVM